MDTIYRELTPYFLIKENKVSLLNKVLNSIFVKKEIVSLPKSKEINLDNNFLPYFLKGGENKNDLINIEKEIVSLRKEKEIEIAKSLKNRIDKEEAIYLSLKVKKIIGTNYASFL
jgi:hypothetical protein